jgi:acyl carrier protein
MSRLEKDYQLQVIKMVLNTYLNQITLATEDDLKSLEANRDQVVWDLATKIYGQSGHTVELHMIRDAVDSKIREKKKELKICWSAEMKPKIFTQTQKVIHEQLGVDKENINLSSKLNHLGMDELDWIEFVIALEEEFEIEISDFEAEETLYGCSVETLVNFLYEKVPSQSYIDFK